MVAWNEQYESDSVSDGVAIDDSTNGDDHIAGVPEWENLGDTYAPRSGGAGDEKKIAPTYTAAAAGEKKIVTPSYGDRAKKQSAKDAANLNRIFIMQRKNKMAIKWKKGGTDADAEAVEEKHQELADMLWDNVRDLLDELSANHRAGAALEAPVGELHMSFLHVACMNKPPLDVIERVIELSSNAPRIRNKRLMLPLHLAARFGADIEVIKLLVYAYPESRESRDEDGRVPLHWAFDPVAPEPSLQSMRASFTPNKSRGKLPVPDPRLVKFLLTKTVMCMEDLNMMCPGRLFMALARTIPPTDELGRGRCKEIMYNILTYVDQIDNIFQGMFDLPQWCLLIALTHPGVKCALNRRSVEPLVASIIILDVVVQVLLIISFAKDVDAYAHGKTLLASSYVRYVGIAYMSIRAFLEFRGFMIVRKTRLWFTSGWNWLKIVNIYLVTFATVQLHLFSDMENYRLLVTFTGGFQWITLLTILKSTNVPFSVFVTGLQNIMVNLIPFALTTFILFGSFGFMYFALNFDQSECAGILGADNPSDIWSEVEISFCTSSSALLSIYIMFVGGIDDEVYKSNRPTMTLTIVFAFLMVVLQLNVLIAVITDSYSLTKERGVEVFWYHRFFYLNEVDTITRLCNCPAHKMVAKRYNQFDQVCRRLWDEITWTLFDEAEQYIVHCSCQKDRFVLIIKRFLLLLCLALWCLVGLVTLGWLWPRQIREYFFLQDVGKLEEISPEEEQEVKPIKLQDLDKISDTVKSDVNILFSEIEERVDEMDKKVENGNGDLGKVNHKVDSLQQEMKDLKQSVASIHQLLQSLAQQQQQERNEFRQHLERGAEQRRGFLS